MLCDSQGPNFPQSFFQLKETTELPESTMECSKGMRAYPVLVWFISEVVTQLLSTFLDQDISQVYDKPDI